MQRNVTDLDFRESIENYLKLTLFFWAMWGLSLGMLSWNIDVVVGRETDSLTITKAQVLLTGGTLYSFYKVAKVGNILNNLFYKKTYTKTYNITDVKTGAISVFFFETNSKSYAFKVDTKTFYKSEPVSFEDLKTAYEGQTCEVTFVKRYDRLIALKVKGTCTE